MAAEYDQDILNRVIDIVVENLDASRDQVTAESRFVDDLGADSLDIAELVMELEDQFDVSIPENNEEIRSVGDAVKFIQDNTE
jgi:acyl carrier protein